MATSANDLLTHIEAQFPRLGIYLRTAVLPAIDTVARNAGVSSEGFVPPPEAPQGLIINKQGTEHVQITVQHTSPIQKGVNYFTEVDTSPSFPQPRVEHHGTSRAPVSTFFLPTNDSLGSPHTYYFRTYAQNPGGQASTPYVYPLGVTMSGTTNANHTASTGSGTAAPDGSQGGQGLGNNLVRLVQQAKRNVNS